jgi:hypothetical protein
VACLGHAAITRADIEQFWRNSERIGNGEAPTVCLHFERHLAGLNPAPDHVRTDQSASIHQLLGRHLLFPEPLSEGAPLAICHGRSFLSPSGLGGIVSQIRRSRDPCQV